MHAPRSFFKHEDEAHVFCLLNLALSQHTRLRNSGAKGVTPLREASFLAWLQNAWSNIPEHPTSLSQAWFVVAFPCVA